MPPATGMMPTGVGMGTTVPAAKPPGAGGNAIDANRSVFNKTDLGYMKSSYMGAPGGPGGQGQNQPTIKQFIEQILKVPGGVDAPVTALVSALSAQRKTKTMPGKMQNMGRQGQAPGGMPRPPMPPMGAGAPPPPSPMGALGGARPAAGPGAGPGQGASRLSLLAGQFGGA